jgi:hypothetical protein
MASNVGGISRLRASGVFNRQGTTEEKFALKHIPEPEVSSFDNREPIVTVTKAA